MLTANTIVGITVWNKDLGKGPTLLVVQGNFVGGKRLVRRSLKYIKAVSVGMPVVDQSWLAASVGAGCLLATAMYEVVNRVCISMDLRQLN